MKSGQRTAIARRCLAAVAHACHAIGAGCGWLRRLANALHHPEARHERTPPECLFEYRGAPNAPPQRDGRTRPALAGSAEGSERNVVVPDAGNMLHDGFAVGRPGVDAEGEVSSS